MRAKRKNRGRLVVFLFAMSILTACNVWTSDEEMEGTGGFLWHVEHEDTQMYLQGTIHIGEEDFYPLNGHSEEAYETADVVLPEIDINNVDEQAVQALTMELATYDDGTTLHDHVSEEVYAQLSDALGQFGMQMAMFDMFKPWFFEMLITELYTEQAGYSFEYAVDTYFLDRAEEDEKEIIALETYEDQMEMLAGFSEEHQLRSLEHTVSQLDQMEEETHRIVSAWRDGDLAAMGDMSNDEGDEGAEDFDLDEFMYEMNEVRNIDMAEQLVDILESDSDQTYFVIVGAMHFVAEPSIVSLLEENGFDVTHVY